MLNLKILSNNQLKIIACVFMLIDHIGFFLFPQIEILRIIGRLAFPIFAFCIAEGCKHTKNKLKYFLFMLIAGLIMLLVQFLATSQVYGNVFLTFSLSICLIFFFEYIINQFKPNADRPKIIFLITLFILLLLACFLVTVAITIDYDFVGVLTPLIMSIPHILLNKNNSTKNTQKIAENSKIIENTQKNTKKTPKIDIFQLICIILALIFLSIYFGYNQWYCLFAIPIILMYDGTRGTLNLKYLFYIFYPAHIVILYYLSMLI